MTSHLFVPALDPTPGVPATLSEPILTGLLRKKMGFNGLIVTDALEMAGVTNTKVIAYLAAAVRDGRIPISRIDQSVRRILEAKAAVGLDRNRFVRIEEIRRSVASKAYLDQAYRTFESSTTLVRNEGGVLPLAAPTAPEKLVLLSLSSDLGDYYAGQAFVTAMRARFPGAPAFYADGDTGREALDEAFARASGATTVVLALFSRLSDRKGSVDLEPKHIELIGKLTALENGPRVVAVSFGSPYFLRHIPGVDAYVCMYRNTPETQEIAARALAGEMDVAGRLPVSIPDLYPLGHGLELKRKMP
jgi:beta-N-acetylhexosaminidase